ncbi:MAG: hypothetical protein JXR70_10335, partial [Spirochaetales bacterium]|nr:hypothetical protein [Spirochaetales bacterium]
ARECNQRISKRSGVMESLVCCNEMKAGNAQHNNQLNKYEITILVRKVGLLFSLLIYCYDQKIMI